MSRTNKAGMPGDLQSVQSSVEDVEILDDDDDSSDDEEEDFAFSSVGDESKQSESDSNDRLDEVDEKEGRDETEEINRLIRKESKDVLMWREIVTGMLVITAALVTITTFVLLSREEVADFTRAVSTVQSIRLLKTNACILSTNQSLTLLLFALLLVWRNGSDSCDHHRL